MFILTRKHQTPGRGLWSGPKKRTLRTLAKGNYLSPSFSSAPQSPSAPASLSGLLPALPFYIGNICRIHPGCQHCELFSWYEDSLGYKWKPGIKKKNKITHARGTISHCWREHKSEPPFREPLGPSLEMSTARGLWPLAPLPGMYPVDSPWRGQKGLHGSCFQQQKMENHWGSINKAPG